VFVFLSLCFRNPFLLFSPFTLLSFNFPKVPLLSFLLLCFSPLLFLSRFLSSYPLTVAFFVSKLPSPFSFKRSLSLVQNSTSHPSHHTSPLSPLPPLSFGASPFYRGERSWSLLLVRLGSKSCCGWSAIGRDCRGSAPLISAGRAAGRGTVSKRHCSNSFFYIYIYFIFVGTQKWVTIDAPSL